MHTAIRKTNWIQVSILCLAGGTIFLLPFLRYGYYDAMRGGMGLTNVQLGVIMGAYGMFTIPSYLIGGYLADRLSAKRLLIFSFVSTGLGGFYLAQFPSYLEVILIHGFWGITTILTFWPAFYKIVRFSAEPARQGRMFGIVDGGRRVAASFISFAGVYLFSLYAADQVAGFRMVVYLFSAAHLVVAALIFVFWKHRDPQKGTVEDESSAPPKWADIQAVLKMPATWAIAGIIFGIYGSYRMGDFFTPYTTQVAGIGAAVAAFLGYAKSYAITPVGSLAAGFLGDRIGISRTAILFTMAALFSKLLFIVLPVGGNGTVILLVANILFFMAAIWGAKTLFYALLEEAQVPARTTGTVIGVASTIGFLGEVTSPLIGGYCLDVFGSRAGFNAIFIISAMHALLGVFFLLYFRRVISGIKITSRGAGKFLPSAAIETGNA